MPVGPVHIMVFEKNVCKIEYLNLLHKMLGQGWRSLWSPIFTNYGKSWYYSNSTSLFFRNLTAYGQISIKVLALDI